MKRIKTFLIYAIIIVAFGVFSNILIYLAINSSYTNVETKVLSNSPEITILQSKATYVNGVVRGSIKNNTNDIISNQYLKIDLYSPRDIKLGTKYVKIENLQTESSQDFEMWYKFTDVEYAIVTVTDNIQNVSEEEFLSEETKMSLVIGTLLILYFI